MAKSVEKTSPLANLATPHVGSDQVVLSERLCESLVQVQAWPDTVGEVEATLGKLKDVTQMPSGPGRWLVEAPTAGLEAKLRKSIPTEMGAVTGLTHGRVVVNISGEKASWVLSSGIALDFHADAFPVGTTKLTHHHEIGLTIHRVAENSFDLYVFTSLVRGLWHWLETACAETGYSVV